MEKLTQSEIDNIGGGVDCFGPCPGPSYPDMTDPDVEWFIQWKLLHPEYPY
jgi:hypothetical protein